MKIITSLLILCASIFCVDASTIPLYKAYTATTSIQPFGQIAKCSSARVSGTYTLNSDTSLVRVILVDNYGKEYLMFEAYSMVVENNTGSFSLRNDETSILFNIKPVTLKIITTNGRDFF